MNSKTVLLAEDDRASRHALDRALSLEGYRVVTAADGVQALAAARAVRPDVLVLDVMMPRLDGVEVCRVLREKGDRTPILMLTARAGTSERVAGLDSGADDYVPKPFDVDEVFARLRALLRRASDPAPDEPDDRIVKAADVRLDPFARRVWRDGTELELTRTEFDLLELLVRNAGIVLEHATIYERVWGYDFGVGAKNLSVYIGYLRRKLDRQDKPSLIHAVRGVGYCLRER